MEAVSKVSNRCQPELVEGDSALQIRFRQAQPDRHTTFETASLRRGQIKRPAFVGKPFLISFFYFIWNQNKILPRMWVTWWCRWCMFWLSVIIMAQM